MDTLAQVIERQRGKEIEVVTSGGQKLSGIVQDLHEDYFTLAAVSRVHVIPFAAVSSMCFPRQDENAYPSRREPTATPTGTPTGTATIAKPRRSRASNSGSTRSRSE